MLALMALQLLVQAALSQAVPLYEISSGPAARFAASLDERGVIVYLQQGGWGSEGIYKRAGGRDELLARTTSDLRIRYGTPILEPSGRLFYLAETSFLTGRPQSGILEHLGPLRTMLLDEREIPQPSELVTVTDLCGYNGQVVFTGSLRDGGTGLFSTDGSAHVLVERDVHGCPLSSDLLTFDGMTLTRSGVKIIGVGDSFRGDASYPVRRLKLLSVNSVGDAVLTVQTAPKNQLYLLEHLVTTVARPYMDLRAAHLSVQFEAVFFHYEVHGSAAPRNPRISLYWSQREQYDQSAVLAYSAEFSPAAGLHLHVLLLSDLQPPPPATRRMFMRIDPDAEIHEDKSNNMLATPVALPPDREIIFRNLYGERIETGTMGEEYRVHARVKNHAPFPILARVDWIGRSISPALPEVAGPPGFFSLGTGAEYEEVLAAPMHRWNWIPQENPTLEALRLRDKALEVLAAILGNLWLEEDLAQLITHLYSLLGAVLTLAGLQFDQTDVALLEYVSWGEYEVPFLGVTGDMDAMVRPFRVEVPWSKEAYLGSHAVNAIASEVSYSAAVTSLLALNVPSGLIWIGLGSAALGNAYLYYELAKDPPDSDFLQVTPPEPIAAGVGDEFTDMHLRAIARTNAVLDSLLAAAATARNRADGALIADNGEAEALQLAASAELGLREAVTRLELASMLDGLGNSPPVDAQVGPLAVDLWQRLRDRGWQDQAVDRLLGAGAEPRAVGGAGSLLSSLYRVLAYGALECAFMDMERAVGIRIGKLGGTQRSLNGEEVSRLDDLARVALSTGSDAPTGSAVEFLSQVRRFLEISGDRAGMEGYMKSLRTVFSRDGLRPERPVLRVRWTGGDVFVSWSTNFPGYRLEASEDVVFTAVEPVLEALQPVDGTYVYRLPKGRNEIYLRLRQVE